jgi:hypothetical protein
MKNFAKRIAAPHKKQFLFKWLVNLISHIFFCEEQTITDFPQGIVKKGELCYWNSELSPDKIGLEPVSSSMSIFRGSPLPR